MIVDNFAASCRSHNIVASFAMSSKIMTEHHFLKGFKAEENSKLKNTEINNCLMHRDTA